jgi:hypothetical protein
MFGGGRPYTLFCPLCSVSFEQKILLSSSNATWNYIRGCNQKFPDWVDNEITTTTTTTTTNSRWEAIQRVMAAKLTSLTHKIATQLPLVVESCTICSSRSRRPVRKLLDTPSYSGLRKVTARLVRELGRFPRRQTRSSQIHLQLLQLHK